MLAQLTASELNDAVISTPDRKVSVVDMVAIEIQRRTYSLYLTKRLKEEFTSPFDSSLMYDISERLAAFINQSFRAKPGIGDIMRVDGNITSIRIYKVSRYEYLAGVLGEI